MVQRLTNKAEIRRRLNSDRDWALYALADLDDPLFGHCDWWAEGESLVLVFRALEIRPIFVMGDGSAARNLLCALPERSGYLNLRPHQLDAVGGSYAYRERHTMQRMILGDFQPRVGAAEPLTASHHGEIERLYASGDGGGIAFARFQLDTGFFRGVRRQGELVAVAGVHVVSRNEDVAGVGNIFTRPDCRGQGLAQMATSAVVMALREAGIGSIGLNVEHTNAPAIRAYESLGFRTRFHYYEGVADRHPGASPPCPGT